MTEHGQLVLAGGEQVFVFLVFVAVAVARIIQFVKNAGARPVPPSDEQQPGMERPQPPPVRRTASSSPDDELRRFLEELAGAPMSRRPAPAPPPPPPPAESWSQPAGGERFDDTRQRPLSFDAVPPPPRPDAVAGPSQTEPRRRVHRKHRPPPPPVVMPVLPDLSTPIAARPAVEVDVHADAYAAAGTEIALTELQRDLREVKGLRRAIVLKEILSEPIALRRPDQERVAGIPG